VRPPSVPDDLQKTADLENDFGQMGFRIPAVAVSPYTRDPKRRIRVDHTVYGHESILKLILYRFGLERLTRRSDLANNIGAGFNWRASNFEPPELPDPEHIASRPCEMGGGDVLEQQSAQAHENDLAALEGLAERFGLPVGDGQPHELFTQPDSVRRALAGSA
jgi:phospholipase C